MIKYSISGNLKGDAIVFINGAGVGPWMWNNQINYFTNNKCITFDLPGHGINSDMDFTTIKNCANIIRKLIINESNTQKAVIIGHSIGAQILMFLLEFYEEVVERAVIISGLNQPMPMINFMIKPMINCLMPVVKWRGFAKMQSKQLAIPDNMFENYYRDSINMSKETLKNILYENSNYNFQNSSNTLVKALILVGENEKNIMKQSAFKNRKLIQNSNAYIIKNAAHGIPYEQGDLLNYIIENFINDNNIYDSSIIEL